MQKHTQALVGHVNKRWPAHANFLQKSFQSRTPESEAVAEQLASAILTLATHHPQGMDGLCDDYRFLVEVTILQEEIHFRRHGRYRLSTFAEANAQVYSNAAFMARYMYGLLSTQVLWPNHCYAFTHFVTRYLPTLQAGARHLEIGPGHGLYMQFAAASPNVASLTGWDLSATSIAATRDALRVLGATQPVELVLQNLFDAPAGAGRGFDSVVMSELVEHLEDPVLALRAVREHMAPGGRLFIHVPANAPSPDHIFLVTSLAHACSVVQEAGFQVIDSAAYPMAGSTLAQAERLKLAVSCIVVAKR
jgi:2-polyprenyl-3-methyl-5-hydroxy-6-metoxy-1,4-benzoquinol methylase